MRTLRSVDLKYGSLFDQLVDVNRAPAEAPGERACNCGLSGAHEPDQVNLVSLQWKLFSPLRRADEHRKRLKESRIGHGDRVRSHHL